MDFINHESSNIHSTAHDPETDRVHVRFTSGGYHSYPCTADEYEQFKQSESKGKAFHSMFRSREGQEKHGAWK